MMKVCLGEFEKVSRFLVRLLKVNKEKKKKNSGAVMMNCESDNLDTVMMKVKSLGEFKKVLRLLVRLLEKSIKCIFN